MPPKSKSHQKEAVLSRILGEFDEKDKRKLAEELIKELGLDLDNNEKHLDTQIQKILGRKLTPSEKFKVDILERIKSFHGTSSDIIGGDPPPPPM